MKKIIHLVPYDGIGGVETAARSMNAVEENVIDFQVRYIFKSEAQLFRPGSILKAAKQLVVNKPDMLIVSLWRSCIVGLLVKFFRPRLKLVIFLHLPTDAHFLDRVLTRISVYFSSEVWADSKETLSHRVPGFNLEKGRIISFVTHRLTAPEELRVSPSFMFWGRVHPQKGLDHALHIFAAIHSVYPAAKFNIIGPNGGDLERIQKLVENLKLSESVMFYGGREFEEIESLACDASFYLQTSLMEGMAMSVVEAMQLGLVPVVTPVGEIGNYCQHGENSLLVNTDQCVIDEILAVLCNQKKYSELRENAIATWAEQALYSESVLQACGALLLDQTGESMRGL